MAQKIKMAAVNTKIGITFEVSNIFSNSFLFFVVFLNAKKIKEKVFFSNSKWRPKIQNGCYTVGFWYEQHKIKVSIIF
jgi:hypothetical protein